MIKAVFLAIGLFFISFGLSDASSLPVHSQDGNLIQNGNFELGNSNPWNENDGPTYSISSDFIIDGDYSLFVDTTTGHVDSVGNWMVGMWQYHMLEQKEYTVSGWFYPIAGNARLGIAWNSGTESEFTNPTSGLNEWQYLEHTVTIPSNNNYGGALLYGLANTDKFYVDGVWLNEGSTNLSPYSPENGFPGNLLPPNEPPVAMCNDDQVVHDTISLNATGSYDADGTIDYYNWILLHRAEPGFDRNATGENPTIENLENGFYDVQLTVTDDDGATATASCVIAAAGPCVDPIDDLDGDGIPDEDDECPNSDLSGTIIINDCDTGVENRLLSDGCTLSDILEGCHDDSQSRSAYLRCIRLTTKELKKDGFISSKEKRAIYKCAKQ